MSTAVGKKIKQLRLAQKKKLKDISEETGISISYLSKLERENYTASRESLEKISEALGVKIEYFFEGPKIVRSHERAVGFEASEMITIENLTTTDAENRNMAAVIVNVLPDNEKVATEPHIHLGEEVVYVLQGVLTVILDGVEYELYPGDCLYFTSGHSHLWLNRGTKITSFLSVSNAPKQWASYNKNKAAMLMDED